jgi:WD domain, G-beta repeat
VPGPNQSIKIFDASLGKEIASFQGHNGAIASLAFAADGKTLVSGGNDTTLLVWDVARIKRGQPARIAKLPAKQFEQMWTDLVSPDGKNAGKTVQTLIACSNLSVAMIKSRLQPAAPIDVKQVDQWLHELDSSNFKTRALAMGQLEKLGELAIPALQKTLATKASPETRRRLEPLLQELLGRNFTPDQIRVVRAVEVLERVGTDEAKQLLEYLAQGAPGSLTTRQARTALDRLGEMK